MADSPPFKPHHSSNKKISMTFLETILYDEIENIKTELDDVKTNFYESQRKLVSLQSQLTRSSSETFDKERKYELLEQKLRIQQQKNKDHEKLIGVLQNDRRSQHNSERDLNNQISQLQNELKEAKEDGTQKSADLSVLLVGYDDLGTEKDSEIERLKTRIVELEADHDVSHNMSNQVFLTAANTPNMSLNSSNIINPSKDNTENMEQILMRAENEELKSEIKILKSDLKTQIEVKEREQEMVKTYEKIVDDELSSRTHAKISISKKLAEKVAENEDLQSELRKQKTEEPKTKNRRTKNRRTKNQEPKTEELKSEIKILKSDLKTQIEIKEREQEMVKTYEKIIDDENTQKVSISKKLAEKVAENEDLQSELRKQKTDIKEQLRKIAEFGETAKNLQTVVGVFE